MPITNHVTSKELSRRLRELKVPQNSHFVWFNNSGITGDAFWTLGYKEEIIDNGVTLYPEKTVSAYLASELGELLPYVIRKSVEYSGSDALEDWYLSYEPDKIGHTVRCTYYYYSPMDTITISADTEADARAKMLIFLLENHLISVEELGK